MRRHPLPALALLALFALSSCATAPGGGEARLAEEDPAPYASSPAPSSPATRKTDKARWEGPDFEVTTFDGKPFRLARAAGRPVVLNFWESW